jgi:hypothetical protein
VLELAVQQIAFLRIGNPGSGSLWSISAAVLNPWLSLVATTRGRVIKMADGTELCGYTMERTGKAATFTEWGAKDAQLLLEDLDQLTQELAAEILAQVFGVSVPPATVPAAPNEPEPVMKREG